MSVTIEQMRPKLLTVDQAAERLASTEPLDSVPFTVSNVIRFVAEPGWSHGLAAAGPEDTVKVTVQIGRGNTGRVFQMTRGAVEQAATLCGMTPEYAGKLPAKLLEDQLNFWFREGLTVAPNRTTRANLRCVISGRNAIAFVPHAFQPISSLLTFEATLLGLQDVLGKDTELLVDYKLAHSMAHTYCRIIVPELSQRITGTPIDDDVWSAGVQLTNSMLGRRVTDKLQLTGYLFRWWCTNGAMDTRVGSVFRRQRRGGGSVVKTHEDSLAQADAALQFARDHAGAVAKEAIASLGDVQRSAETPVVGSIDHVLREIFQHYNVMANERKRIIDQVVQQNGAATVYDLIAAITIVANDPKVRSGTVNKLLDVGGQLTHTEVERCDKCFSAIKH